MPRINFTKELLAGFTQCINCGNYYPKDQTQCPDATCRRNRAQITEKTEQRTEQPKIEAAGPAKRARNDVNRIPNNTELRFRETFLRNQNAQYEAITFRIHGHRYTPDWITQDENGITAYEIKGAYRFGSQGRSRLAFDAAKDAFPAVKFVWATYRDQQWEVEQ